MGNLIENTSAYLHNVPSGATTAQTDAAIASASEAIERVCRRVFGQAAHDEICKVGQFGTIHLDNFPVVSVDRLFTNIDSALRIRNTGSITSASVNITKAALRTVHTASGTTTVNTLAYSDNATIADLVTAIDALGTGWDAEAISGYSGYPSADLVFDRIMRIGTSFQDVGLWTEAALSDYRYDADTGIVCGLAPGATVRVKYTGGFATVPEPIQEVCGNLVVAMLDTTRGGIVSERLGDYSVSYAQGQLDTLPIQDRQILTLFRDKRV